MVKTNVNGVDRQFDGDPEMPLLWYIRDEIGATGTKFGCGQGYCGACTVHVNGVAQRSCITPIGDVEGAEITTIEAVSGRLAETVQQVWTELDVVQCGYCQSGQVMQAISLLNELPSPSDDEIASGMSGNICRCATYVRIRAAVREAAKRMEG